MAGRNDAAIAAALEAVAQAIGQQPNAGMILMAPRSDLRKLKGSSESCSVQRCKRCGLGRTC
ncbi:hypothetical protein MTR_1061s0010 [Medicago truncatula]|uniref:Uncharacterized protein n=1 Tax=Medicago truncatula TaxID=3880 RepID=A0A072TDH5_MEDTR|nr:hypothetical protein MTR_1061s0010 [Medicago truncatula]